MTERFQEIQNKGKNEIHSVYCHKGLRNAEDIQIWEADTG